MIVRTFAGFLILLLSSSALAEGRYSMREDTPRTGSRIRSEVARWALPFSKKYEDFDEGERNAFRSMYVDLPAGDEPPYPAEGMEKITRDMVTIQQALQAHGTMRAAVEVDEEGNGRSVKFFELPDPELAKPVAFVLINAKYKPARCSGQPCAMEFPFFLELELR